MTPAPYANFLVVSAGASAVLIGLLFVSVSVAPERVFGRRAEAGRQARALSSFTAFANVFFISLAGLIPNQPIGPVVVILGALAASQTLSLLLLVQAWRREATIIRGLMLFAVSGAVYGYEIVTGVRLSATPTNAGALTTLLQLLLGCYAIGLARAWERGIPPEWGCRQRSRPPLGLPWGPRLHGARGARSRAAARRRAAIEPSRVAPPSLAVSDNVWRGGEAR